MGGGKGGGSAQKSTNYYGTIAGAIGWGPIDWLRGVVCNGNYLFKNDAGLVLTADVTDLTGSLVDPSMLAAGGYLKIYRGTETQPADAALAGHPPYLGTALLVAKNIFFGQESGIPPNLQVIAGRLPRVPTTIVAAADNFVDDKQVNPIACWAEILLDERGAGLDAALLDAPSWLASAHWCAQDQAHRDFTFVSPLFTDAPALREIAKALLEPFNGFCRWTPEGKLACSIYEWGVDPGGLATLDASAFTKKPQFTDGSWDDVPTEIVVSYVDRAYEFQEDSVPVPNSRARKIRQVDDSRQLERKHTLRRKQAFRQGAEWLRRIGTAPGTGILKVRAPLFPSGLLVGDKVRVDVDPEPGGDGLAALCRIERIEQGATDELTVEVMTDALAPAIAYTPGWADPVVAPDASCQPISHALALPLPLAEFGSPPSAAFCAQRPDATVKGFHVLFALNPADTFTDLGQQTGWAVRATLGANLSSSATSANFTQTDGLGGPDANLAADTPGGNTTAAAGDLLLAALVTLDAQGRVALSGDVPVLEFVSIVSRSAVSGATFTYTLLRGRLGTAARAWTAATTSVWIIPKDNLVPWRHNLLTSIPGTSRLLYFRLIAYNDRAADDSTPPPEADINLPPVLPPTEANVVARAGYTEITWKRSATATTEDYIVRRNTVDNAATAVEIGRNDGTFFQDSTGTPGQLYFFYISALNDGVESARIAAGSAVALAALSVVVPAAPAAATLQAHGTELGDDGTVYAWFRFAIPALPANAIRIELKMRLNAAVDWSTVNQVTGAAVIEERGLIPGRSYYFAITAWSVSSESALVAMNGGLPYTADSDTTLPGAPTGVTAAAKPGFNHFTWLPPSDKDMAAGKFLVYRGATNVFAAASLIDETKDLLYDDNSIAPGSTWWYFFLAKDPSGNVGPASTPVSVVAAAAPATDVTPANPAAPVFVASGTYETPTNEVLAFIDVTLDTLPAGAIYQRPHFRLNGTLQWKPYDQVVNAAGAVVYRIDALACGARYELAVQAWSATKASAMVLATSPNLTGVTASQATDLATKSAHGLLEGQSFLFVSGSGFAPLVAGNLYYARGPAANTFSIGAASTGVTIDLTSDGTAGVLTPVKFWSMPLDTVSPAAPTGFGFVAGDDAALRPPPVILNGVLAYAMTMKFTTPSLDSRLVQFIVSPSNTDATGAALALDAGAGVQIAAAAGRANVYHTSNSSPLYVWTRCFDWSGNVSALAVTGDISSYLKQPAGDLVEQSRNAVNITGGKMAVPGFEANLATAVDIKGVNFRVFDSAGTQQARHDNVTGDLLIQGSRVVSSRKAGWGAAPADGVRRALTAASSQAEHNEALRQLVSDLHQTSGHGLLGS